MRDIHEDFKDFYTGHPPPIEKIAKVALAINQSSGDGGLAVNSAGRIFYTNKALDRMFGYEEGELLGEYVEILVPEHLREMHIKWRQAFMASPAARPMGQGRTTNLQGRRKDGGTFSIQIGLSGFEHESLPGYAASVRDIATYPAVQQGHI